MPLEYVVHNVTRKPLWVDDKTYQLVRLWAHSHGMTISHATWTILAQFFAVAAEESERSGVGLFPNGSSKK